MLHPAVQLNARGKPFVVPDVALEDLPELARTGACVHKKGGKGSATLFGSRS